MGLTVDTGVAGFCALLASAAIAWLALRWLARLCARARPLSNSPQDWGHEDPYPALRAGLVKEPVQQPDMGELHHVEGR